MSNSLITKASAVVIGFSLLTLTVYPASAEDATTGAALRKPLIQQKINIRQEKVASRTVALKAKLETFKDKRKAEIADRINTNLNRINANQTEQMLKHLNQMSVILDKLEVRVGSNAAIVSARTNIATTSAAVSTQAQKDYTITVTSESRIKADAKQTRDKLHSDLQALRKLVINAKQSVGNAIRIAKSETVKEGSESGRE